MNRATHEIVLAGGGTGGHLYPGLAVADALRETMPEARVTFVGGGRDWERREVAAARFDYQMVPCRGLVRPIWRNIRFLADNAAGYLASRWLLRERRVSLVVGLGGYASAPTVRAAISLHIPVVLLEQNAVPGRVTQWLAPMASTVCVAFPQVEEHLRAGGNVTVTGNPIRRQILALRDTRKTSPGARRRLLVLGGSGGARPLNQHVPKACYKLAEHLDGWRIIHQTGSGAVDETSQLYRKLGLDALVVSFIDNLPSVLRETDLVVCRGGATTLAELATVGIPAIVVPDPNAIANHQLANAKLFVAAGACRLVQQDTPGVRLDNQLRDNLVVWMKNDAERLRHAACMRNLGTPDATNRVVEMIQDLLRGGTARLAA